MHQDINLAISIGTWQSWLFSKEFGGAVFSCFFPWYDQMPGKKHLAGGRVYPCPQPEVLSIMTGKAGVGCSWPCGLQFANSKISTSVVCFLLSVWSKTPVLMPCIPRMGLSCSAKTFWKNPHTQRFVSVVTLTLIDSTRHHRREGVIYFVFTMRFSPGMCP